MKGKILSAACALLLLGSLIPSAGAGSLTTSVIGMFPKDVGEFAYADLKTARHLPWFAQFKDQVVPSRFRQFEKFLAAAGIDPDTQVDELAWAAVMPGPQVVKAIETPKEDAPVKGAPGKGPAPAAAPASPAPAPQTGEQIVGVEIGRASCRERV